MTERELRVGVIVAMQRGYSLAGTPSGVRGWGWGLLLTRGGGSLALPRATVMSSLRDTGACARKVTFC